MEWDDDAVSVKSWDEDSPRIGYRARLCNEWYDLIDPHPFLQRESHSRVEFGPDYIPSQLMTM